MLLDKKRLHKDTNYAIAMFVKAMEEIQYDNKSDLDVMAYCEIDRQDMDNLVYANLVEARAEYYARRNSYEINVIERVS